MIESDNPLGLDPKDGFHVILTSNPLFATIYCVAYGGGRQCNLISADPQDSRVQIREWVSPTPADLGAATRLQLVLDAIARYLTTGGQWDDLEKAVWAMRRIALGGLVFPDHYLVNSYSTYADGTYQHIFVSRKDANQCVLWEEPSYLESGGLLGGFIEAKTSEEIREEQENDDAVWGKKKKKKKKKRRRKEARTVDPPAVPQIPYRPDPQTP